MTSRKEAASVLRRVTDSLPLPPRVVAYLRGYADGLECRRSSPNSRSAQAGQKTKATGASSSSGS